MKFNLLNDLSLENKNALLTDYAEVVLGFQDLPILKEIDKKYWPLLVKNSKIRDYFKGDTVYNQGDYTNSVVNILLKGQVAM